MAVPFFELQTQFAEIGSELREAIERILASQRFILGPAVERLEREVADYCGVAHAVGVSSGTDALLASLMVLGIGPGDEVITSAFTFFATAGSIARLGARPVFADIDPQSYNIDPQQLTRLITPRTKAIIPVHLFGQLAEMERINRVAEAHGLVVIEDAAQAIGAARHGRRAGQWGRLACFSFYPTKNLGGAGDGGMVVTDDAQLAERLRMCRNHGCSDRYVHQFVGGNFRLDALQAAVLSVKLRYLDAWHAARRRNAELYNRKLAGLPVRTPVVAQGNTMIYNQYVIELDDRRRVIESLRRHGIGYGIYYPAGLHLQKCFKHLGYKRGDLPVTERASERVLALPIYPELTEPQIDEVVAAIAEGLS